MFSFPLFGKKQMPCNTFSYNSMLLESQQQTTQDSRKISKQPHVVPVSSGSLSLVLSPFPASSVPLHPSLMEQCAVGEESGISPLP